MAIVKSVNAKTQLLAQPMMLLLCKLTCVSNFAAKESQKNPIMKLHNKKTKIILKTNHC